MFPHIERELHALSRRAARILDILAVNHLVFPNCNQRALEELLLGAMRRLHLESLTRGSELIASDDMPFADSLAQFGKDAAAVSVGDRERAQPKECRTPLCARSATLLPARNGWPRSNRGR